jgi:hypothetical protein
LVAQSPSNVFPAAAEGEGLVINTRLALTWVASAGLAACTVYWLYVLPDLFGGRRGARSHELAALAGAFVGQVGLYAAIMGPVAAYALAGRWVWSVRLLTAVSVVIGLMMLSVALHSYEHAGEPARGPEQVSEFLYGAMLGAGFVLLYALYVVCTLAWIGTCGRASRSSARPLGS